MTNERENEHQIVLMVARGEVALSFLDELRSAFSDRSIATSTHTAAFNRTMRNVDTTCLDRVARALGKADDALNGLTAENDSEWEEE